MANGDLRHCPHCCCFYIEDDNMYEDVDICPCCGADVFDSELEDNDDDL